MLRKRSEEMYKVAKRIIPGGVNSPARSWSAVRSNPLFIARGEGSRLWDADGNSYIDYVCSWGPMILGHAHPEVIAAIKSAVDKGISFGAPTEMENHLAQLVVDAFPSIDLVRFVNSGTEAGMSAIRLARAYTGRDKIIKFKGGYHGHADALLVASGSGAAAHGVPTSAGITNSLARDTLVARYNDLSSIEACFHDHAEQVACVIVEPIAGNMGVIQPQPGFLEGLRKLTTLNGALLIFDEVITGYRVAYGGAQHVYAVTPDITCLGKIIGGGLPVGAYGGRIEIMKTVSPLGPMYQAGTLSGNPVAMAAGAQTLQLLQKRGIYGELESAAQRLEQGLKQVFAEAETPLMINRVGSMMTLFFNTEEITGWQSASDSNGDEFSKFFHRMLEEGVYLPPSPLEAMFVSTAHSSTDIESTVEAARRALR